MCDRVYVLVWNMAAKLVEDLDEALAGPSDEEMLAALDDPQRVAEVFRYGDTRESELARAHASWVLRRTLCPEQTTYSNDTLGRGA